MTAILDIILSFIIGGILLLTILRVDANLTDTAFQSSLDYSAEESAIGLGQIFEYDFYKIGYHATDPKITYADTARISFKADLENDSDVVAVTYSTGTIADASSTPNPNDFPLYRQVGGSSAKSYYGLTWLKFTYYDSSGTELSTPMTLTSDLEKIKSIRVQATMQSTFPYDTTYSSAYWERTFFPMNL
jgi:hypothetical protein